MKVILNSKIQNLGHKGDIVEVRPGYFRNFLAPNEFATQATKPLIALALKRKEMAVVQKEQVLANAKDILAKIKGLKLSIKAKVSDKGTLFASVNEEHVIESVLSKTGVKLDKSFIKMTPVKELGKYKVEVALGDDLSTTIALEVKAEK